MENFGNREGLRRKVGAVKGKKVVTKRQTKRARVGESSGASGDFARFVNEKAAEVYKKGRSKNLIPERGVDIDLSVSFAGYTFRHYQWAPRGPVERELLGDRLWFADQPEPAVVEIVHEFYANLKGAGRQEGSTVMVRGKPVDFSSETINKLYSLTAPAECWYNNMPLDEVDWDEILAGIAKPGTEWKLGKTGEIETFPTAALERDIRVVHYFLCARLIPTGHTSEVTRERALLLYALVSRLDLNVGAIIRNTIVGTAHGKGNKGLAMPSLITTLCTLQGVPIGAEEVREKPKAAITRSTFDQMRLGHTDVMFEEPEGAQAASPERVDSEPAVGDHEALYDARLGALERSVAEIREQQQLQYQYSQSQFTYLAGCFDTMYSMWAPLMGQYGSVVQLPQRPPAPDGHPGMSSAAVPPSEQEQAQEQDPVLGDDDME